MTQLRLMDFVNCHLDFARTCADAAQAQGLPSQFLEMLAKIDSGLTRTFSALDRLSDRVNSMDSRLGQLEGQQSAAQNSVLHRRIDGALISMSSRLERLSDSVTSIDDRLDQQQSALQSPPALAGIDRALTSVSSTLTSLSDSARSINGRLRLVEQQIEAWSPAGTKKLQAAATEAQEEAAKCRAEKESLHSILGAIREACECPILQEFTADMVVASDGEGYDRRSIQQWQRQDNTSPVTREPLEPRVFPNRFARRVYDELQKAGMGQADSSAAGGTAGGIASSSTGPSQVQQPKIKWNKWQYVDDQGEVQGPFTTAQMKQWYNSNSFPSQIRLRRVGETNFSLIREYFPSPAVPFVTRAITPFLPGTGSRQ